MAVHAPTSSLTERSAVDLARAIRTRRDELARGRRGAHRAARAHARAHQRRRRRPLRRRARRRRRRRRRASRATTDPDDAAAVPRRPLHDQGIDRDGGDAQLRRASSRAARGAATENAPTVQRMIDAGAIPLGVTNTPELCLWIETENRQYGRTNNAYDATRTAGGSSGGEGAVVGSGGSPLGPRRRHRRLDPHPGVLQRRLRPQAVARARAEHRPVPDDRDRDRRDDAHDRADHAPRRGPHARCCASSPGPTASTRTCARCRSATPPTSAIAGMRILLSEDTSYIKVSRELRAARLRAAEALEAAGAKVEIVAAEVDEARARALPRGAQARGRRQRHGPHRRRGLGARDRARRPASARARTRARCGCC